MTLKPATPLPWHLSEPPKEWEEYGARAIQAKYNALVGKIWNGRERTQEAADANAAYIIASANYYPKLIAALRECRKLMARELTREQADALRERTVALLRELNEEI